MTCRAKHAFFFMHTHTVQTNTQTEFCVAVLEADTLFAVYRNAVAVSINKSILRKKTMSKSRLETNHLNNILRGCNNDIR